MIFALVYGSWLSTKSFGLPSASNRRFANRACFSPVRFSTFKNRAGVIMSVSIFSMCIGAAMPLRIVNFATFDDDSAAGRGISATGTTAST